jgi:hypothetical protein
LSEAFAVTVTGSTPGRGAASDRHAGGDRVALGGVGGGNAAVTWNVQHFLWSAPGWRSETHAVAVQLPSPE